MIRYIDLEQGSALWHKIRECYVTGTDAHWFFGRKLKTPDQIIIEKHLAKPFGGNYYTRRGHLLEPIAKEIYSKLKQPVKDQGFIINDKYPKAGYSPDGLTKDGLVECKCFEEKAHRKNLLRVEPKILHQIQFGLFVTERPYCDLILFNPEIEQENSFKVWRIKPQAKWQDKFKEIVWE